MTGDRAKDRAAELARHGYRPRQADSDRHTDGRRLRPTHGTRSRYRKGCRCDQCREAEISYIRAWRATRQPTPQGQAQ